MTPRTLAILLLTVVAGCGGDDDPPESSPVEGTKPLSTLTVDEKTQLCDWGASLFGGYGKRRNCSNESYSTSAASREVCVEDDSLADCEVTVDQFERCARALHDRCLAGLFSDACEPIEPCVEFTTTGASLTHAVSAALASESSSDVSTAR